MKRPPFVSSPIYESSKPEDADNFHIGWRIVGWFDVNDRMRCGAMPWRKDFAWELCMALGWYSTMRVTAVDRDAGTITMGAVR